VLSQLQAPATTRLLQDSLLPLASEPPGVWRPCGGRIHTRCVANYLLCCVSAHRRMVGSLIPRLQTKPSWLCGMMIDQLFPLAVIDQCGEEVE
jgi:hypothetical protein